MKQERKAVKIVALEQACLFDDNPEYDSFVAKFEPKKTTDDCYTPPLVYAAIRDWVCDRYDIDPACIVRPFFPGGDFVNYEYDVVSSGYETPSTENGFGNQTIAQSTETLKWRILNIDEAKGTVDLASAAPTSNTVGFKAILGYNNGPYVMDKICEALYSNNSRGIKARSIDLLDMEQHLTAAGIAARNADSGAVKYGTTKTYTSNTKYPSLYANQKGAGPNITAADASAKITQPKTDAGNDPYEESKPIATTEPTTDNTSGTGNPLTVTQTFYYIPIYDTNYGTASSILANGTTFWVAARYVYTYSDIATFGLRIADTNTGGYGMFDSSGSTNGYYCALRPVVSLPSSLLTGEQTNGAWNLSK